MTAKDCNYLIEKLLTENNGGDIINRGPISSYQTESLMRLILRFTIVFHCCFDELFLPF